MVSVECCYWILRCVMKGEDSKGVEMIKIKTRRRRVTMSSPWNTFPFTLAPLKCQSKPLYWVVEAGAELIYAPGGESEVWMDGCLLAWLPHTPPAWSMDLLVVVLSSNAVIHVRSGRWVMWLTATNHGRSFWPVGLFVRPLSSFNKQKSFASRPAVEKLYFFVLTSDRKFRSWDMSSG